VGSMNDRIRHPGLRAKLTTADDAARYIHPGDTVALSGFTGSGHPKAVPGALAERIAAARAAGEEFRIRLYSGASTAPEVDGALAKVDAISLRLPFQSDPDLRAAINEGRTEFVDTHLSQVAEDVAYGFYGDIDIAVVEVTAIREDGSLVPSTSIGNNACWLDTAARVILEVNYHQPLGLEGMHDVYTGIGLPPHRTPVLISAPGDRIGDPYLRVDPAKVVAVVETDHPDRNTPFSAPDATTDAIAAHVVDFLLGEVKAGRLPPSLLPLQSGVGNVPNAVLYGLRDAGLRGLTAYTEVIQDGLLELLRDGVVTVASTTAFSLSPDADAAFRRDLDRYRDRIVLRTQEVSNHPEVIRRLGSLGMNGMLEADIYGNVNSTHVMGSRIVNGIGGSGDFARNCSLSVFMSASTAKGGSISTIVPMVSHVDHTEHDTIIIATEQGVADLRGLSPKQRVDRVIDHCAHPDYREALRDYSARARRDGYGQHTPHLLGEALSWHERWLATGTMRAG
jgi:succinyl-CoA:acetate CoA-transferase